jgi:DNA primase
MAEAKRSIQETTDQAQHAAIMTLASRAARKAVERQLHAQGRRLSMIDGPGAMVIIDVDPGIGAAIAAVVASSDGVQNVKAQRLFSMDEVIAIRKKRIELQSSYSPPGL